MATSAVASVGPFLVCGIVAGSGLLLGSLAALVLGVLGMTAFLPIVEELWRRVLVAGVGSAGLVGVASMVPAFSPDRGGAFLLLASAVAVILLFARLRGWPGSLPRVDGSDALVLIGAGLVGITLFLPLAGRSAEQVLLDLSLRYDNLPHFVSVGATLGDTLRAPAYNYGYHTLIALGLAADPGAPVGSSSISVTGFAVMSALLGTVCAGILGFLTLGISRSLRSLTPWLMKWGPATTSLSFLVWAPLSGAFATYHLVGHLNFLYSVTVAAAASWLALDSSSKGRHATAASITLAGVIAAFSFYRSTQVGLAAAAGVVTWRWLESRHWSTPTARRVAGVAVGALVFAGWVPFHYYALSRLSSLSGASVSGIGALLAVPPATVLAAAYLAIVALYAATRRFGHLPSLLWTVGPSVGLAGFAVVLAVEVARRGDAIDNYYVWKGAAAAAYVLVPAIFAGGVVALSPRKGDRSVGKALVGFGALMFLVALPGSFGGGFVPSGVAIWDLRVTRMSEAGADGARLLVGARELGSRRVVAAVLPGSEWAWGRPEVASRWLAAVRGMYTDPEGSPESCLGREGDELEDCLSDWAEAHPEAELVIVDGRCELPFSRLQVLPIVDCASD